MRVQTERATAVREAGLSARTGPSVSVSQDFGKYVDKSDMTGLSFSGLLSSETPGKTVKQINK